MKKLFFILALGAFAAACNNSSESTEPKADSPAVVEAPATPAVDSTVKTDSAVKVDSPAAAATEAPKK